MFDCFYVYFALCFNLSYLDAFYAVWLVVYEFQVWTSHLKCQSNYEGRRGKRKMKIQGSGV